MTNRFDYHGEYNELLSNVTLEFGNSFAAMASPTLSKQETVTFLFESINHAAAKGLGKPSLPWYELLAFIPRLILMFTKVFYVSSRFRVTSLPDGAIYFRTWLVPRSISDEGIVDDYFRGLPQDLSSQYKVVIGYYVLQFNVLKKYARNCSGNEKIIAYGLLSPLDIIKLFLDYIFSAYIRVRTPYTLASFNVTPFINKSLLIDYLGLRSFGAYAEKYVCAKLIAHKIKTFIYVFENQAWEKVACSTLRSGKVGLIGYQSSGFSPVFLNFFQTQRDSFFQPMPDILLTVGEHFKRYLLEHAHYKIPIKTFSALRFSYPKLNDAYVISQPNEIFLKRILYAFPVQKDQYVDIINDLIEVFEQSEIHVDLKFHPLYELDDIDGMKKLPSNFRVVSNVDMNVLKENYDSILFNDNSFGIEALLMGVKSHQYSRDGSFRDDRFMYFNLWPVNYKLIDIYKLKDEIESCLYDKKIDTQAVSDYINSMYHPYGPNSLDQFKEILQSMDC